MIVLSIPRNDLPFNQVCWREDLLGLDVTSHSQCLYFVASGEICLLCRISQDGGGEDVVLDLRKS